MKINKVDELRIWLEAERKRIMNELEQLKSSGPQVEDRREGSPFGKREEEASETFELEKKLALERGLKQQLAEIEHALEKYENGTYGRCDICNKLIDPARLEARPQANLCMDCKAKQAKEARG